LAIRSVRYDPTASFEVREEDVEYRREGDQSWLVRVHRPVGDGPFPALLDVHGGVWTLGDRTSDAALHRPLAASGLTVFAIDFRLAPKHPYPATVTDVNYATRWVKTHVADFNATADVLGVRGGSSGGHLAMLSALRPRDPRYSAVPLPENPGADASVAFVVACWPILDPYARYFFAQDTGRTDLITRTEGHFLTEDGMQEGNPQLILDRGEAVELPPALIVQGTADDNVPPAMQERFVRSYRARGGTIDIEIFGGMGHAFIKRAGGPQAERALERIKSFIATQLERAAQ
jgi:acetyl esterase